jgi:hypothetical protein
LPRRFTPRNDKTGKCPPRLRGIGKAPELGWIYAQDDGHGGVWLWHESQGWLWTNPNSYRYLYQADTSHWLYFLKRKDGQARFYNYATGKVE